MPALFIGHGNPMYALGNNRFHDGWKRAAELLPRPRAVLCISAHFETRNSYVTAHEAPETIHDFYGFPRRLFDMQYRAPGSLEVAQQIHELVTSRRVRLDEGRGLDHGCWSVMSALFPDADVPVLQLSLDMTAPPEAHYALGGELADLREEGVLIIGSGNMVHNLPLYDFKNSAPVDWALRADQLLRELIEERDHDALCDPNELGDDVRLAVPTLEHYLPLLYVLGAQTDDDPVSTFNAVVDGTMSMRCVRLG
ncbi:MAG: 4,5-DOPA dioxygenase extradiol [Archangium gephyra]|uniref:4,5-DOPA dioxygenase extradiol n=1 Tax=Archangium gephyra TaxID=48 RepID=A0A2W5VWP1_9BACT|nr:MAG: 4,5-DOPA dioxygenase extradiol [Archangium gephyra]